MKVKRTLFALALLCCSASGWTQGWSPQRNVEIVVGNAKELRIIAFKGSSEALTNVLGGHIDLTPAPASVAAPHVNSAQIRLVAVAAPRRLGGAFATVPTWKEQGVDLVM